MRRTLTLLVLLFGACLALAGCGPEKADVKKDSMDAKSLEALKNPPPGMPPPPAGSAKTAPPGTPEGAK